MRSPYCIGVWKASISLATAWVSEHYLGDNVIQFLPDTDPTVRGAVWVMLRVTGDQRNAIVNSSKTLSVI
jgi:hypothetical protein